MKKIRTTVTTGVASLGLVVGMAGFAGATTGTIDTTGPRSNNQIESNSKWEMDVDNDNDVRVDNDNDQHAYSGDARTSGNTTGGDAESGEASNANTANTSLSVDNGGAGGNWGMPSSSSSSATIENTGPRSNNQVEFNSSYEVKVNNDNDVRVDNDNDQHASSGDATVRGNTTGGNATSGSASNTNSTSTTISIKN